MAKAENDYVYPSSMQELTQCISENHGRISYTRDLKEEEAVELAEMLKSNTNLHYLHLKGNSLSEKAFEAIGKAVAVNTTLKKLYIYGNKMKATDVKHFADALRTNETLTHLCLYGNEINDEATEYLAEGLVSNKTLKYLLLEKNCIGNRGIEALAAAFRTNKTLEELYIQDNSFSQKWKGASFDTENWRAVFQDILDEKQGKFVQTEVGAKLKERKLESYAELFFNKNIKTLRSASRLNKKQIKDLGVTVLGDVLSIKKLFGKPVDVMTEVGETLSSHGLQKYTNVFYDNKILDCDVAALLESEDLEELGITDETEKTKLLEIFASYREQDAATLLSDGLASVSQTN